VFSYHRMCSLTKNKKYIHTHMVPQAAAGCMLARAAYLTFIAHIPVPVRVAHIVIYEHGYMHCYIRCYVRTWVHTSCTNMGTYPRACACVLHCYIRTWVHALLCTKMGTYIVIYIVIHEHGYIHCHIRTWVHTNE